MTRARKTYRVWHVPGMSEEPGMAYFAVEGPRVDEFLVCEGLAAVMQRTLNTPPLSATERRLIRDALAMVTAGETPDGWTSAHMAIADALLGKLK